jgi:hypothetical protein
MELNEQTLEQILTRQRQEYERLLAKRDEKLDSVVASLSGLDGKVSGLDAKVSGLDTKVNSLDTKIEQAELRLEAAIVRQGDQFERYMGVLAEDLKSQIQLVAEGVSTLFTELSKVHTEDEKNKKTILKLELDHLVHEGRIRKKADREDLTALESRVSKLEMPR